MTPHTEQPSEVRPSLPVLSGHAGPRSVRLSITDRCNLACVYCRPAARGPCLAPDRRLTVGAWAALVRALASRGVRRVRITGGEPLMHPEVVSIVRAVAETPGIDDLALTTNATGLARLARPLRDAGLRRLNVSLDSLRPERFRALTRGGDLGVVLDGLRAAREVGFDEVKTNTVVLGLGPSGDALRRNDDELEALVRWAWREGLTPRFIELMPVGEGARCGAGFVPYAAMRERLSLLLADEPASRQTERGPAVYAASRDGSGRRVGFITGTSGSFCEGCDRLRVTADGHLRPCLATSAAIPMSAPLLADDHEALAALLDGAWAHKPASGWGGCTEPGAALIDMVSTGG